ncbi:peptide chain release factor 2 [Candidatus Peregrinibacteria bacterium HGW-Peregrinibacteria-1]|jgi:peptide chain release factor 2|nr:MAG: peptide chain release factor 2 [Candidatus Peregrinibacteria bacterium HGW-Peregrinibacteria-1]
MHEIKARLVELKEFIEQGVATVDLENLKYQWKNLNAETMSEGFWDDSTKAQEVSQQASDLAKEIESWEGILEEVNSLLGLLPEISPESDPEGAEEFRGMVAALEVRWRKLEILTFLNGKYDKSNAILSIHAGTGGTDASDFAEMLLRMYLRYGERSGFGVEILDKSMAEEAGIKSCTVALKGAFAYGYLKNEAGVHRLVRLSPFNSKHTRETSFALVEVVPEINNDIEIKFKDDDLRIDVFRSGGSGGQSVNTTDSAVRITHLPTGVVVQCQNERSQLQNKEQAMKLLKGKLLTLMEEEQAEKLDQLKGGKKEMSWGNQIRSYVLHPYKMVKDHRTGWEETNPDKVLDGEIEGFVEAKLKG